MVFGKSKEDTNQDAQITQVQKDVKTCWDWIQAMENYHKEMNKLLPGIFQRLQQLEAKDKQHDAKDIEHDKLIENLKNLGKVLEGTKEST